MVDMTNRADVAMRLGSLELFLRHLTRSLCLFSTHLAALG
jgi:hypothetical protein